MLFLVFLYLLNVSSFHHHIGYDHCTVIMLSVEHLLKGVLSNDGYNHFRNSSDYSFHHRFPKSIQCRNIKCETYVKSVPGENVCVEKLNKSDMVMHGISPVGCVAVKCLHCTKLQYVCTVCNCVFDRRRYLFQHIKSTKKHMRIVDSLSSHFLCVGSQDKDLSSNDQHPNQHIVFELDSDGGSISIQKAVDMDSLYEVEHQSNRHLDYHLDSDNDSVSLNNQTESELMNRRTKEAVERHGFVEDIKETMHIIPGDKIIDDKELDLSLIHI